MSYLNLWSEVYNRRKARLKASDWTQVTDSPLSDEKKAEWAAYRQTLRDIPLRWPTNINKEITNPYDIIDLFPTKPQ